jgi:diguanylate cyclase (GGDEF)-like protein/PAS domain S-box-containing protein
VPGITFCREKTVKSWLRICALLVLLASSAQAAEKEIRIGVLSFRSLEQTKLQWQATADYLNTQMAGFHFSIIPMYYSSLDLAINRHELDFVLTNPEYYTTLHADHALSAIATLMPLVNGNPVSTFGGVILARADRADINSLADVRGKVVASPNEHSLGGYLMERWALYKQGIMISQIARIQFTDMPHDKAVLEVLNGTADVAFVRTGILEGMAHDGSIRIDQFKVLNRQPLARFPQLLSTDLYPEWPFAAMPNVPDELVKRVTLTLLNIQPQSLAARQGNYFGFSPPGNYAKVEAVMERLKVDPERKHQFSLRDVASKYGFELISGALLLLLTVLTVAIYLARTNRNLQKSYRERERLDSELQQINATLEDKVARRTRELRESETRFRRMFEHHASPMLLIEPVGGGIVNANHAAAEFYGYSIEQMTAMNIGQINVQPEQLTSGSMLQAQQEKRNFFTFHHRLANGEICTVEVHSSPVEVEGRSLLFSIIHDITERNQLEAKMHDLAFYDPLTRLPNRRLLVDRLNSALISAARNRQHGALMFLDLDHFKVLNDLHGHDIGDQMLVEVARRILSCIRSQDSAARFGGDEFVVMLEELSKNQHDAKKQAGDIAEKIRRLLAQPYLLQRGEDVIMHHCSSSIGVTVFLDHEGSLEQLLKRSDMAMYRAKDAGRNVIRFFDPDMQFEIETGAALEADLHSALAQQEFRLFYQVQVNILGKPHGAEVLLRWQHPGRGLVSPDQFIPLAEGTGLIVPIGEWVLDTVCTQIKLWEVDVLLSNLVIAVNVSAKQFRHPDFVGLVKKIVLQHDIRPELLKLELTESLVLEDIEDTIAKMKELKALGLSFSMDDFGTGYSSLSHLKRLPLDQIKIDQSFVRDITTDKNDLVMVNTIVDLGMNFEMEVIAEGVETQAQLELLQRAGCISFQGYLFSKPVPLKEFETLLKRLYDA